MRQRSEISHAADPQSRCPKYLASLIFCSPGSVAQLNASQGIMPLIVDWLREDARILIFTYQKYLVLWNVNLENYQNKNVKDIALINVVEELNGMHPPINVEVVRNY